MKKVFMMFCLMAIVSGCASVDTSVDQTVKGPQVKIGSYNIDISDEEIQARLKKWKPYEKDIKSKLLLKYRALVTSAAKGAILKYD